MQIKLLSVGFAACLSLTLLPGAESQTVTAAAPAPARTGVGDMLDNPPPRPNLPPALEPKAIAIAMRKVGDWELERSQPYFSQDWTFAALYTGFMAAAKTLPEPKYEDAMLQVGNKFDWKLG